VTASHRFRTFDQSRTNLLGESISAFRVALSKGAPRLREKGPRSAVLLGSGRKRDRGAVDAVRVMSRDGGTRGDFSPPLPRLGRLCPVVDRGCGGVSLDRGAGVRSARLVDVHLQLAEWPIRLVDRSRANRGIGADGQVADGEVVHPVGVRVRPCSKLEQSSATGDVSTSSSV